MANINRRTILRIYGVTLPRYEARADGYGHGEEEVNGELISYVDYKIEHLITLIKNEGIEKEIINKLK